MLCQFFFRFSTLPVPFITNFGQFAFLNLTSELSSMLDIFNIILNCVFEYVESYAGKKKEKWMKQGLDIIMSNNSVFSIFKGFFRWWGGEGDALL